MKMNFDYDNVNAMSNALGSRIQLLEELIESNGLSPEQVNAITASDFQKDFIPVYGFHIDSEESDPSEAVTYLADAVGMKPAYMDYTKGEFNYGSWEDAFFMPRPCMLKYDGTVDYYLDPNDYSKKEDGTDSDVDDFEYGGNAMMEWGRNGHQIWYKIVPDEDDNTSASIYFCEYKLDEGYHAWSFINNQGVLVDHFYTPIYQGTIDGNGKLRSISGKANTDLCQNKTAAEEIEAAELNNPGEDSLWYTEVYADIALINLLLVLIGKCLDTQLVFGDGASNNGTDPSARYGTGTMDEEGLFFGANDEISGVKVFGMENYWGNQQRRFAGFMLINRNQKYKLTRGTDDGSLATDYNTTGENYIDSNVSFDKNVGGYISSCTFLGNGAMLINDVGRSAYLYYCDYASITSGSNYAYRGDSSYLRHSCGAFCLILQSSPATKGPNVGASLSCKPLAQSE